MLGPMKLMMALEFASTAEAGNIFVPEIVAGKGNESVQAGALARAHSAASALIAATRADAAARKPPPDLTHCHCRCLNRSQFRR